MAKSAVLPESEYWQMFEAVKVDVEASIQLNTAYLAINDLARDDDTILATYNRFAAFWKINAYAQQSAFFMAFGRIFDDRRDTYSIQKLVDATAENVWLFSKSSLRRRKHAGGDHPDWLIEFMKGTWEPTQKDFQALPGALAPHVAKFREIYQPIRHQVFAHRGKASQDAILALFSKTRVDDVAEILRFAHAFANGIWNLAYNGRRLDLNDHHGYDHFVHGVRRDVERFVRNL